MFSSILAELKKLCLAILLFMNFYCIILAYNADSRVKKWELYFTHITSPVGLNGGIIC